MYKVQERILANEKIRDKHRDDVLVGILLDKIAFENVDLIIGDGDKLPDIYAANKVFGVEIVQIELTCDFVYAKIIKEAKKHERISDARKAIKKQFPQSDEKIIEICRERFIDSKRFFIQHKPMASIYQKNIGVKLDKLNKGYYENITGDIFLAISNHRRRKTDSDIEAIQKIYSEESSSYERQFKAVFVITARAVYKVDAVRIIWKREFTNDQFNECIVEMKKALKFDDELYS